MRKVIRHRHIWQTIAVVALLFCGDAETAHANGWETGSLAEAGFNEALGDQLDAAFAEGKFDGLHGIVVVRHGKLLLERYYPGVDERWGQDLGTVEHDAETRHDLRSVSKSIVGLLYGIALDERLVPPIDAPLLEQFPQYPDVPDIEAKRAITIEHVLTMTLWPRLWPAAGFVDTEIRCLTELAAGQGSPSDTSPGLGERSANIAPSRVASVFHGGIGTGRKPLESLGSV